MALGRVHGLEDEVRGRDAKMDKMDYAFETAFRHWKHSVQLYPVDEGGSELVLTCKRVLDIGDEELRSAKRRGTLLQ